MTGIHEISLSGNGVRIILRVEASGFIARFVLATFRSAMRKPLAAENRGLKARLRGHGVGKQRGLRSPALWRNVEKQRLLGTFWVQFRCIPVLSCANSRNSGSVRRGTLN